MNRFATRQLPSKSQPNSHLLPQTTDLFPLSSEPILFPRLRIHFADFPYSHFSIDQRLFTLETCCGYEYGSTQRRLKRVTPSDFQGIMVTHQIFQKVEYSASILALSPINSIPGSFIRRMLLRRKENSSWGNHYRF
jgi:hypothetical protein